MAVAPAGQAALALESRVATALNAAHHSAFLQQRRRTAVVLGGGLSGLSLAWFLQRAHSVLRVIVVEKSERPGGWVHSHHRDGHVLEAGPRGVRPQAAGQETVRLAEQLGLADQLIAADPAAKLRYLYLGGKLQRLPSGLLELRSNPLTKWVPDVLKFERQVVAGTGEDESIADFITRRFNRRVLDELVDPLISGIYAGDPAQLSVQSCFGRLPKLEQEHGSVVQGLLNENLPWPLGQGRGARGPSDSLLLDRGPPSSAVTQRFGKDALVSFKGGMSTLTNALAEQLDGQGEGEVRYGAEARSLDFSSGEGVEVGLADGTTLQADHVFCALPGDPTAALLQPHSAALAAEVGAIPYAPVALVTMAWERNVLPQHLVGFGHLVPYVEQQEVLGMTWDSCTFPQQAGGASGEPQPTRLTVFVGGTRRAETLRSMAGDEAAVADVARRAVASHLGVVEAPAVCDVHYMERAIPQYHVGHKKRVERVERLAAQLDPRLTLAGSLLYGVACNDIVAHARQTALTATLR